MKKSPTNKDLIYQIEQQIIETGSYQAIELLLRLNYLPYADYEQWRMGEINYFSDLLSSNRDDIFSILNDARHYVRSLKMSSEPLSLTKWGSQCKLDGTHNALKLAPDNHPLLDFISMQYLRENNDDQLDLFFDNQSITIINDLKRALISRDIQLASQKYQALYDIEPQHEIIKPAEILLDTLINALEEEQVSEPEHELNYLLTELAPLAREVLAGQERDYMALYWRRLARYIDDSAYDEEPLNNKIPDRHSSFCFAQIPDWQAVIQSIESVPSAHQTQSLIARYAIALRNSGLQQRYFQAVCQYYWQFSDQCLTTLVDDDPQLKKSWNDFFDQELDNNWGKEYFPCWLLIHQPGIGQHITSDEHSPEAFKILHALILTEISEKKQSIFLRKQLKIIHAEMLEYYLKANQ